MTTTEYIGADEANDISKGQMYRPKPSVTVTLTSGDVHEYLSADGAIGDWMNAHDYAVDNGALLVIQTRVFSGGFSAESLKSRKVVRTYAPAAWVNVTGSLLDDPYTKDECWGGPDSV